MNNFLKVKDEQNIKSERLTASFRSKLKALLAKINKKKDFSGLTDE
ncbi:MAG TPA: hypothetical protein PLS16_08235 [Chitinophagales bacterium]|nr:hypothetical protein [Chitinophagales bacterium]